MASFFEDQMISETVVDDKVAVVNRLYDDWCLVKTHYADRKRKCPVRSQYAGLTLFEILTNNTGIGKDVPLSKDALTLHVNGDIVLGIYTVYLDPKGVCWCKSLFWDIDHEGPEDDLTMKILDRLSQDGFNGLAIKSSDKTRYVCLVLDKPISAELAYAYVNKIAAGLENFDEGHTSIDCFPKQPRIEKGGYGNFNKLPGRHQETGEWGQWWEGEKWCQNLLEGILQYQPEDCDKIEPGDWVFNFVVKNDKNRRLIDFSQMNEQSKFVQDFCNEHGIEFLDKGMKQFDEFPYHHINIMCPFSADHSGAKVSVNDAWIGIRDDSIFYCCAHTHCAQKGWIDILQKFNVDSIVEQNISMTSSVPDVMSEDFDWIGSLEEEAKEFYPVDVELPPGVFALYTYFLNRSNRPSSAFASCVYVLAAIMGKKMRVKVDKDYSGCVKLLDLTTSGKAKSPDLEYLRDFLISYNIGCELFASISVASFFDRYGKQEPQTNDPHALLAWEVAQADMNKDNPPINLAIDDVMAFIESMTAIKMPSNSLPDFCVLFDDSQKARYDRIRSGHLTIDHPRINLYGNGIVSEYAKFLHHPSVVKSGAPGRLLPINSYNVDWAVDGRIIESVDADLEKMMKSLLCMPNCEIDDLPFDRGETQDEAKIQNAAIAENPILQNYTRRDGGEIISRLLPKCAVQAKKIASLLSVGEAAYYGGYDPTATKIPVKAEQRYQQLFALTMVNHFATFEAWDNPEMENSRRVLDFLQSHSPEDCTEGSLTDHCRLNLWGTKSQGDMVYNTLRRLKNSGRITPKPLSHGLGVYYVVIPFVNTKHVEKTNLITPEMEADIKAKCLETGKWATAHSIYRQFPVMHRNYQYDSSQKAIQQLVTTGRWDSEFKKKQKSLRIFPKKD